MLIYTYKIFIVNYPTTKIENQTDAFVLTYKGHFTTTVTFR